MWWTNSTWLNCLESLQVREIREIFTGVFTFRLESDLLFSYLWGDILTVFLLSSEVFRRLSDFSQQRVPEWERINTLVIKLKQKRILDLAWSAIALSDIYEVDSLTMHWIHMDTMRTPCSPRTQESEPQCHSLHLKSQCQSHLRPQCHTLHRSSIILGLPWTFVCSKKTQKFTSRRWRLCFTQCSWRLQQSSPCRLHV